MLRTQNGPSYSSSIAMYTENLANASSRYSCSTCVRLFFPRRLDPVLDRCKRDEDAMVAPEVPGGSAVRQAILHHASHGSRHNAVGVMTIGHGQIQHVGVEVMVAVPEIVLGIGHVQIARTPANGVAEFVQRALASAQTRGATVTQRTTLTRIIA